METSITRDTYSHYRGDYKTLPGDLYLLDDLADDYEVVDDEPDIRGWQLVDQAGRRFGKVQGLLVSPTTCKAYFAIARCDRDHGHKLVALPLAYTSFDADRDEVIVPYFIDHLPRAPAWTEHATDLDRHYTYWFGTTMSGGGAGPEASSTRASKSGSGT